MKNEKILFPLFVPFLAQAAGSTGFIVENDSKKNYEAAIATAGQENHHTFDHSTSAKPINAFIVGANGGKNDITMKGDPTVGNTVVPKMKNFDGTDVLEPKNWTIIKEKGTGVVTNNKTGKLRYLLGSNKTGTGAVTLGDRSYKGENQITFENTSIKSVSSNKVMFANQHLDSSHGMSDTTITFKGNNFLYQDGAKATGDERDAVHFYKNEMTASPREKTDVPSHTKIVSEAGSTLNMYVKSGSVKARGIGVTQYKD